MKININYKKTFIGLIFLSLILRISQINFIPFWDDEIYILAHTNPYSKIADLFNDPGNPPLYFILFKIYRSVFENPIFYRFLSLMIGLFFNISFFIYLKSILGKKRALVGLFIVSINVILIYFSQEIRCYMLLMLLATTSSYLLFKFNNKIKNIYLMTIISLLYTHFYGAFFVFYNFIFGLKLFLKNKDKLSNFIKTNVLAFLAFLPLIIYKFSSITTNFNSWLKTPILEDYYLVLKTLFSGFLAFVILCSILFFLYKKARKIEKLFISYNFLAIPFVLICAVIVSYLIKPIFCYRYFYVVFPSVLALITYIVSYKYKTKLNLALSFSLMLLLIINLRVNYQNLFCNHNLFIDFVSSDIDKTKNNYVFMTDTVKGYKPFEIKGANQIYLEVNKGMEEFPSKEYELKDGSILYILNLYLDKDILKRAKKIDLYKTTLGVFSKVEL